MGNYIGGPGGRPPKFKTVEELERLLDAYFESCFATRWVKQPATDASGKPVLDAKGDMVMELVEEKYQVRPYTVTGLALFLDTTRRTLIDYEQGNYDTDDIKFSHAIKMAKTKVEQSLEEGILESKNPTGGIFNLKNNFGWKDRNEVDITTKDKEINIDSETKAELKLLREQMAREYEEKRKNML